MKVHRKGRYTTHIDGTWCEISNSEQVLYWGSCSENDKPQTIFNLFILRELIDFINNEIPPGSKVIEIKTEEIFNSLYLTVTYEITEEYQKENTLWYNAHNLYIRLKKGKDDENPIGLTGGANTEKSTRIMYEWEN